MPSPPPPAISVFSQGHCRSRSYSSHHLFVSCIALTTLFPLFLSGKVEEDDVVDSKILPYCSIDKKEKKSVGELEQDFLQALQVRKKELVFSTPFNLFIAGFAMRYERGSVIYI